jgi:hypothetical protein
MQWAQFTLGRRVRNAVVTAGAGLLVVGTTLTGAAWADQGQNNQTSAASQQPEALSLHTHALHGTVKTGGSSTFVVTTTRYGDVTVSVAATSSNDSGHGNGHGRGHGNGSGATGSSNTASLTAGERVVVLGSPSADFKTFNARRVHVLPAGDGADQATGQSHDGAQQATRVAATITSTSSSNGTTTLTIKLADGTSQSVKIPSAARIRPAGKTAADLTVGTKISVVQRNGTVTTVVVKPA